MIWLVCIIGFIYLVSRINGLEHKIYKLEKGETKLVPDAKPLIHHEEARPQSAIAHLQELTAAPLPTQTQLNKPAPKSIISDKDWESKIGGQFFTVIGSVAVLFGIAFFLKYAFDHNLISETGRVAIGFAGGVIAIALGRLAKTKYALYGQLLTGLGLAVFYLSIFAGFNYYHLLSQPVAFAGMVVVTGLGILLGLSDDSEALTGFAQFGGFVTPFLLSNGQNHPGTLFTYLLFLDAGIILLNFYKPWQYLNLGGILGTGLVYASWIGFNYTPDQFSLAIGFASLFFALFFAASLIQYFIRKSPTDEKALAVLNINTLFYYWISYYLIHPLHPDWMGPFTFILAAIYIALSFITYKPEATEDHYHNFLMGLGFVLLFVGIPIQFKKQVIAIGWAAQALVMVIMGFKLKAKYLRYLAHCVFLATTFYIFVYIPGHPGTTPWLNTRTISAIMIAACMIAAAYYYWLKKSEADALPNHERNEFTEAISALALEAYIVVFWIVSIELHDLHQNSWLAIAWSVLALGIGLSGLHIKNLVMRATAYATIVIIGMRLVFWENTVNLTTYTPVFNMRVLAFVGTFIALAILLHRLRQEKDKLAEEERELVLPVFFIGNSLMLLWALSSEVLDFYNRKIVLEHLARNYYDNLKNVSLSVSWLLYAVMTLALGITWKRRTLRLCALGLFGVVVVKVFLYDSVSLNNLYRFVSYITLGIILLFTGYLYNRYKDRIIQFIKSAD